MLGFTSAVRGLSIEATDGAIGEVEDGYFDDQSRDLRWFLVDLGSWLTGRRVLLPASHLVLDAAKSVIRAELARTQIENGPRADAHRPVSRQMEMSIYGYYNWAPYWGAPTLAPGVRQPSPLGLVPPPGAGVGGVLRTGPQLREDDDPHLRSADEVVGYYVRAQDGPLGHIEDLLISPDPWSVAALVIDTKNWWPGRKVVLDADVLLGFSWGERLVELKCNRSQIKESPEYDPREASLTR